MSAWTVPKPEHYSMCMCMQAYACAHALTPIRPSLPHPKHMRTSHTHTHARTHTHTHTHMHTHTLSLSLTHSSPRLMLHRQRSTRTCSYSYACTLVRACHMHSKTAADLAYQDTHYLGSLVPYTMVPWYPGASPTILHVTMTSCTLPPTPLNHPACDHDLDPAPHPPKPPCR